MPCVCFTPNISLSLSLLSLWKQDPLTVSTNLLVSASYKQYLQKRVKKYLVYYYSSEVFTLVTWPFHHIIAKCPGMPGIVLVEYLCPGISMNFELQWLYFSSLVDVLDPALAAAAGHLPNIVYDTIVVIGVIVKGPGHGRKFLHVFQTVVVLHANMATSKAVD